MFNYFHHFSKTEHGQRIIEAGGFYVNLSRVTKPDLVIIPEAHILPNGLSLLRVGKCLIALIVIIAAMSSF